MPGYELPAGGPGWQDREFLNETRTPAKERARLKRIHGEFSRAFRALSIANCYSSGVGESQNATNGL